MAVGRRTPNPFVLPVLLSLLASTANAIPAADVHLASDAHLASAARLAYEAGDYKRAYDLWLPLANAGDAEAAFRLGLLADLGEGKPEDAAEAYRWYRRAAAGGHVQAEFNVAVMADSGRGTPHDIAQAAEWYGRAAAHGNHRAQYNLGLLYNAGDGVPQNRAVARAWFRLAASDLPAASEKLHAMRPEDPPAADWNRSGMLHPATSVAPGAGTVVAPGADDSTEIVWSAPAEATRVRYFLQVVVRGDGTQREIYAAYLDVTATLVPLDHTQHAYAWRVYTVSPAQASYTVSPWSRFTS